MRGKSYSRFIGKGKKILCFTLWITYSGKATVEIVAVLIVADLVRGQRANSYFLSLIQMHILSLHLPEFLLSQL